MLKTLVRMTALLVTLFLALVSGIYISTTEENFPADSQYRVSIDFSESQISKDEIIKQVTERSDESGLFVAKIVPDPRDFYSVRNLYIFTNRSQENTTIKWFDPGISGELRAATSLGAASLSGPFVMSGPEAGITKLNGWLRSINASVNNIPKDNSALLQYSLISTGAWLTLATCVVLLFALVITWYSLRSRSRSLKVLAGVRTSTIAVDDLASLFRVTVPSMALGALISVIVVCLRSGFGFFLPFLLVLIPMVLLALAAMLICGLVIGVLSWPSVAQIASREPSERSFRLKSELTKIAAILLTLVFLPGVGLSASAAFAESRDAGRWEPLKEQVSLRLKSGSEENFQRRAAEFQQLAAAAADANVLSFSYYNKSVFDEVAPYDGVVMVNPAYIQTIADSLGASPTSTNPLQGVGQPVGYSQLPQGISESLNESFPLWKRSNNPATEAEQNLKAYTYTGSIEFPGLDPLSKQLSLFAKPLILVVDRPDQVFSDDFIGSVLSSSNLLFSDPVWLNDYLNAHPVRDVVLSVDRVADTALYNSQAIFKSATLQVFSIVLVLLALAMSTAVSARIYALANARRLFTQRTSGWTWRKTLGKRMVWESVMIGVLTAAAFGLTFSVAPSTAWWVLLALPVYAVISLGFHGNAVRAVFAKALAREV